LSYPTVVSRLDQVVDALGAPSEPDDSARARRVDEVLDAVSKGELSTADAATLLKRARRPHGTGG
jgi:hypothetical protein